MTLPAYRTYFVFPRFITSVISTKESVKFSRIMSKNEKCTSCDLKINFKHWVKKKNLQK